MRQKITPIFECFELGINRVGKKLGFAFAVVILQLVSLVGFASPGGNDPVHSNGGSTRGSILQSEQPFCSILLDTTMENFHEIVLEFVSPPGLRIVGGYIDLEFENALRPGLLVTQHFSAANFRMLGDGYQYITGQTEDGSSEGIIRIDLSRLLGPDGSFQSILRIRIEDLGGEGGDLGKLRSLDGEGFTDVLIIAPIDPLDDDPTRVISLNVTQQEPSIADESLVEGVLLNGITSDPKAIAFSQFEFGIALVANPVSESCRLRNDSQEAKNIAVVNAVGAVQMFVTVLANSTRNVDVAHLPPGVYLLVDPMGKHLPIRMMVCR